MDTNNRIPFTDVDVSKYNHLGLKLPEHQTVMSFDNDGGNYAFNEWWKNEGQYQFNEWCKNHPEYKWEYCEPKSN